MEVDHLVIFSFNLIGVASLDGLPALNRPWLPLKLMARCAWIRHSLLKAAKLDIDRLGTNAENARADDLSLSGFGKS